MCNLSIQQLELRRIDVFSPCPGCQFLVCYHKDSPAPPPAAPPRVERQAEDQTGKQLERLSKFCKGESFPTFKLQDPVPPLFKAMEVSLHSSGVNRSYWHHAFTYVLHSSVPSLRPNNEWIHTNIVVPNLSWDEAKQVFKKQFERFDYIYTLTNEYEQCRKAKSDTVHDYAARFQKLVYELDYSDTDKTVMRHFQKGIRDSVLVERATNIWLMKGNRPNDYPSLQSIIDNLLLAELQEMDLKQVRTQTAGTGGSSSGAPSSSPQSSSNKKDLKCDNHPHTRGHTTAQCNLNKPSGSSSSSKPAASSSSSSSGSGVKKEAPSPQQQAVTPKWTSLPPREIICFSCGVKGHKSPDCPNKKTAPSSFSSSSNVPNKSAGPPHRPALPSAPVNGQKLQARSANINSSNAFEELEEEDEQQAESERSLRGFTLIDRTLPAPVVLPRVHKVAVIFKNEIYSALLDSGASTSCVSYKLIKKECIPLQKAAGQIELSSGIAPRVGFIPLTQVTLVFQSPSLDIEPFDVSCAFEALHKMGEYDFLIGQDLLQKLGKELTDKQFADLMKLYGARPHANAPVTVVRSGQTPPVVSARATIVDVLKEQHPQSSLLDALLGVIPSEEAPIRPSVSTSEDKEKEFSLHRERLLSNPDLRRLLEINLAIDPKAFCNIPEAQLRLEIDEAKMHRLWKPQYKLSLKSSGKTPEAVYVLVDEIVGRWFDNGRIELAAPGCRFNNSLTVAAKKDELGQFAGIRVCLDPRDLNGSLTVGDNFQIPNIRKMIYDIGRKKHFAEFDLQEAYLQFPLHPDSRPFTAFTWRGIQYQFVGCPFGISVLPSHFQRIMAGIFCDFPFAPVYLDNIPVASDNWDQHSGPLHDDR